MAQSWRFATLREEEVGDLPQDLRLVRLWVFKDETWRCWAAYIDRDQELPECTETYLSLREVEGEGPNQRLPPLEDRRVQGVGNLTVGDTDSYLCLTRFEFSGNKFAGMGNGTSLTVTERRDLAEEENMLQNLKCYWFLLVLPLIAGILLLVFRRRKGWCLNHRRKEREADQTCSATQMNEVVYADLHHGKKLKHQTTSRTETRVTLSPETEYASIFTNRNLF
nr:PREDICTED: uncharacterized protein LOC102359922 [Latimeria chalumnae]|eukprot:XP_014352510.1 PREDICTED: uncharacterized protein LOC102359922 [Latimeria chalumnae]